MGKTLIPFISYIKQPQKFVLISLLFVLPFAVVIYYGYSDTEERINFVRKEKSGVEYIKAIKALLQNAQQDRGMSNAYLSGDASFKEKLEKIHRRMRDDIKAVDGIEKKYGEILKTTKAWNKIKENWQRFEERELSMTPKESFDVHTELIAEILSLIFYVTNASKLILDPYYDSYYMMDISINKIPMLTEELGKIRGIGAGAIASGAITTHEKIHLLKISYSIKPSIDAIERIMQIIYQENPSLKPGMENFFKNAIASTNLFLAILNDRVIAAEHADIKPEEYFYLATTAIDANFKLFDALSLALGDLLQSRADKFTRERYYIAASLFVVFIFFFYVVARFKNSLTNQLAMEESLLKSQSQLHSIASTIGEGILLIDKNGILTFINPEAERLLGWSRDELFGKSILGIIKCKCHPYELQAIKDCPVFGRVLIAGDYYRTEEISFARKDGAVFPAQCISTSIKEAGEVVGIIIAFQDITESKNREDELRLAVSFNEKVEQWLQTSLKEKEMLLKEVHHRVKNNLQIISSLFSLQSAYIKDKQQVVDIFNDFQNRIRSIAIVHEKLYKSKDLAKINFTEYIKDLTGNMFRSYRVNSDAVVLNIKAEDIYFDVDTAIPLGLIINELVLNSIKHAFPDERGGEIAIDLRHENDMYILIVSDNGVGFPEGLDFRNTKSLGLQLLITLTEQLNGKIEMDRKNGTEFKISF